MPHRSANELTPPAELVARFRRDLETIVRPSLGEDSRLGLAVSGGPDSLALLLLAAAAFPGQVIAATVDHGLRPEAPDETRLVGEICAALGVPHAILTGTMPAGNLQDGARRLRYALLAEWAESRTPWVATAHHLDDVAETFLMRARRGAGAGGLAAMRATRPLGGAALIRPLLGWSRAELATVVAGAGLAAVQDPSNRDPRFDRVRMRRLLAESPELPADRLALAARNLRHAEDALAWAEQREWEARCTIARDSVRFDASDLPYELRRRLVARAVLTVCGGDCPPLRGESLDRLVATLLSGGTGTIAGVKAAAKRAEWRFSTAPARRSH